jgi:hypothetical protein
VSAILVVEVGWILVMVLLGEFVGTGVGDDGLGVLEVVGGAAVAHHVCHDVGDVDVVVYVGA